MFQFKKSRECVLSLSLVNSSLLFENFFPACVFGVLIVAVMLRQQKVSVADYCAYKNCSNGRTTGSRLYRFPLATDHRYDVWIQYTANPEIKKWSHAQLRSAGLCALHFEPSSFTVNGNLKRNMIPKPYYDQLKDGERLSDGDGINSSPSIDCNEEYNRVEQTGQDVIDSSSMDTVREPLDCTQQQRIERDEYARRTYSVRKPTFSETDEPMEWLSIEPPPTAVQNATDEVEKLRQKNMTYRKMIVALKKEITQHRQRMRQVMRKLLRVKRSNNKLQRISKVETVDEFLNRNHCTQPAARTMVKLQLHNKKSKYSQDEKDLAKQLFFHSASAYTRLRNAGCIFPAESSVRQWVAEIEVYPGFCTDIFQQLGMILETLPPEEKVCSLKWDEMSIRSFEEYSKKFDSIEGLVDLGPLGRTKERARYVFLFCLDGLNAKNAWHQPLAFFFSASGLKAHEISSLLEICLAKLRDVGADVKLLTCDQGSSNQSLFISVLNGTGTAPVFQVDNREYFASFDFPHLIKRLLSTLRKYNVLYCEGKVVAVYEDFIETWRHDMRSGTSRLLSHVTETHLFPNSFETMNVKRAFQILSHRFAAAMLTAGHDPTGLRSSTWEITAGFAEKMNKVIDACNAYHLYSTNPCKRPLSHRNPNVIQILTDFVEWSSKWTVATDKTRPSMTMKKLPCLRGLPMTVEAILCTYQNLRESFVDFELAAGLCNQDSVEHFFSKLRGRGGFNPNPTARGVRLSFRHIHSTGSIGTSDRGNVRCPDGVNSLNPAGEIDGDVEKCTDVPVDVAEREENEEHLDIEMACETIDVYSSENCDVSQFNRVSSGFYEQNAIVFFAGYIAYRKLLKNPCNRCQEDVLKCPMESSSSEEMYIEFREYENMDVDAPTVTKLKRPTEIFASIVETQLNAYKDVVDKYWHCQGILKKMVENIKETTKLFYPTWFNDDHPCKEHRIEFLKFLINVKLFAQTKYNNAAARKSKGHSSKLQKFQNN